MRIGVLAVIVLLGNSLGSLALADGLVYQLPADGTWARFTTATDAEMDLDGKLKQAISATGTLSISSVGKVTRNRQDCRWLELKAEGKNEALYPQLILKMLIPESHLQRGKDPLAHSRLTFFDPKPMDEKKAPGVESFIDDGFNRIQYEIDRFRDVFPRPLSNAKSLPKETIETPAGKFADCEVLSGINYYDGPLVMDGRSTFKATYQIAIHSDSPFGVVRMQFQIEGREFGDDDEVVRFKAKKSLLLAETGKGAVSVLKKGGVEKRPE